MDAAPVARLAPSPTGDLHLGHARSFLLAWWSARSRGGRVLLRLEDLDRARVRPERIATSLRDLEWLGLDWDGPPLHQSADPEPYARALAELEEAGRLYPCVCSRSDVQAALSAPHGAGGELRYPGTCRGRFASLPEAEATGHGPAGLRFRVRAGVQRFRDAFLGECTADVAAEVGDFLVARRDGAVAYQLAVVVDDARQGVTEVLRGDDLLPSTPRQLLLQRVLGLPHPTWVHVPLVVDATGERLAKRRGDLALAALRDEGVDPRALVAWAARSAGIEAGERCTAAEATARFSLAHLPAAPVRLDEEALAGLRAARR